MKNIFNWFTPMASIIGAFSIVAVNNGGTDSHYDFIMLTLVFMHTCVSVKDFKEISSEKWKVLLYVYSILSFLIFKNSTILIMLNIIQSWETIYVLTGQEREVDVNKNNA